MTISSSTRKAGPFTGNGTATTFPFTFKVFQASDLLVVRLDTSTNVETALVLNSDYTVTLNQNQNTNPGGSIVLGSVLASGFTLTATSDIQNLQPTDLTNQGGFYPTVINDALDRATIQIQQLQEKSDRSLKLPVSSTASPQLPGASANNLLAWNSAGDGLTNVDPTSLVTVVAYATAYADVFVGNGITTSWTLTRNPASLYNLDVSISGSSQEPGRDYTLSGTTFTMTTPPPMGARIVVKYKEGLPNASGDSQDIRYLPGLPNAVTRTVQSKLRESVSVLDFGADATGVADSTLAIQRALDSGATEVVVPPGTYKITGVEIKSTSSVKKLRGVGQPTFSLVTGSNRVALLVSKVFTEVEDFKFVSTGNKSDGNNTVGIKMPSIAYTGFRRLHFDGFSLRGMQIIQCVYCVISEIVVQNCTYGLSFEVDANGVQCTAYSVESAYISGCTRGISQQISVAAVYRLIIMEYCGSATTNDGAFHAAGGSADLIMPYWEANYRNLVATDAAISILQQYALTAAAPDIVTYVGAAFNLRGTTRVSSNGIETRYLKPDSISGYDLQIGENLFAPLAGGSVRFGNETMLSANGTLTSATWTTVYSIPAIEMSGAAAQRAMYEYTCYAGYADLTTGFDSGTVLNGTMRSFSGTLPAWLRINGNDIQMNVTGSSYGLYYKIVLRRVFPGTL